MKYLKLYENPNSVWTVDTGEVIEYNTKGSYPFSYYKTNKGNFVFKISYSNDTHFDLIDDFDKDREFNLNSRGHLSGRLFSEQKIISFWKFPKNQDELKKVAKDIKKRIDIDIYADNYYVEILTDKSKFSKHGWGKWGQYGTPKPDYIDFVSVHDYKGGYIRDKEELSAPHLMSDEDKKKHLSKSKISKWKKFQKPFEGKLNESPDHLYLDDNEKRMLDLWDKDARPISVNYDLSVDVGDSPGFHYKQGLNGGKNKLMKYLKLYENPNFITVDGRYICFNDNNLNYAFGYNLNGDFKIGKTTHMSLNLVRDDLSGRLFTKEKIITFWHFPKDQVELRKVAKDIKKDIDIDIYKDNWRIEILTDKSKMKYFINNKSDIDFNPTVRRWMDDKNVELIPVQDYNGSKERSKKELETPHLMSDEDKRKHLAKSKISNWKKFQKPFENKLNESPDHLYLDDIMLDLKDKDSRPISVNYDLSVGVGDSPGYHYTQGLHGRYKGRIWLNRKVISFWQYPTIEEFDTVIHNLEKELDRKIFNNDWQIEVLSMYDKREFNWVQSDDRDAYDQILIPVEEYKGSKDYSDEEIALHLMDAKTKQKYLKDLGYKSKKSQWKKYQKPFEKKIQNFRKFNTK